MPEKKSCGCKNKAVKQEPAQIQSIVKEQFKETQMNLEPEPERKKELEQDSDSDSDNEAVEENETNDNEHILIDENIFLKISDPSPTHMPVPVRVPFSSKPDSLPLQHKPLGLKQEPLGVKALPEPLGLKPEPLSLPLWFKADPLNTQSETSFKPLGDKQETFPPFLGLNSEPSNVTSLLNASTPPLGLKPEPLSTKSSSLSQPIGLKHDPLYLPSWYKPEPEPLPQKINSEYAKCKISTHAYMNDYSVLQLTNVDDELLHEATVLKYEPAQTFVDIILNYEKKSNSILSNRDDVASHIASHTYVHKKVKEALDLYRTKTIELDTFQTLITQASKLSYENSSGLKNEFEYVKLLFKNT